MYNRSLGIKLELITDFARASAQAAEQLDKIKESFNSLKETGSFQVKGLTDLNEKLIGIKNTAGQVDASLKSVVSNLDSVNAGAKTASAAMGNISKEMTGIKNAASEAAAATKKFDKATKDASASATAARYSAAEWTDKIETLRKSMVDAAYAAADLNKEARKIQDVNFGSFVSGMKQTTASTMEAYRAMTALESAIARLPFEHVINVRVRTQQDINPSRALSGLVPGAQAALPWNTGDGSVMPGYSSLPGANVLPGSTYKQTALNSGYNLSQSPYGQTALNPGIPQPGDSDFTGPVPPWGGAYSRNAWGKWQQQQNWNQYNSSDNGIPEGASYGAGVGGYGDLGAPNPRGPYGPSQGGWVNGSAPPGSGNGGGAVGSWGEGGSGPNWGALGASGNALSHSGNNLFWGGFSSLMAGGMILDPLKKAADEATNIDDMLHMTYEALAHAGATPENAKKFADAIQVSSQSVGGDFKDNIAGMYPFISSLPTFASGINPNDPHTMKMLEKMYTDNMQLHMVDTADGAPSISSYDMSLDVGASAHNLGYKMGNIDEVAAAYEKTINALVALKNKTASTAGQAAMALKNVGVISSNMGVDPEETLGILGILGENKLLGGVAGNQVKRIESRQAMEPAAVAKLQDSIKVASGGKYNLSMFDKNGKEKGLDQFIGQIAAIESQMKAKGQDQQVGKIEGTLAGLYAGPALGALTKYAEDNAKRTGPGGTLTANDVVAFIKRYTHDLLTTMPEGHRPGEAGYKKGETMLQATAAIRSDGNVKTAEDKLDNKIGTEMLKTFQTMKPEILQIIGAISGMVDAWGRLSPGMQSFIVNGVAISGLILSIVGVGSIFVGSLMKVAGGFIEVVSGTAMFGEKLSVGATIIRTVFAGAIGVAETAIEALIAMTPIGWIAAIIAAVVLFGVAWKNNWGDVQGKTHAVIASIQAGFGAFVNWFGAEWKAFPAQAGKAVADLVLTSRQFISDFPENFHKGLDAVGAFFTKTIPQWWDAGKKLAGSLWDGIKGVLVNIGSWMVTNLNPMKWIQNASSSGTAAANTFLGAYKKEMEAGSTDAVQPFANHLPHSDAKTGPLSQLTASGRAGADTWLDAWVLSLGKGESKIKKAHQQHIKKPIDDVMISIKGDTVAQVESMAEAWEATLTKHGAVIQKKMIDLFNPQTGTFTRVQGDPAAYRMAVNQGLPLQDARDVSSKYISDTKVDPDAANPLALRAILNQLKAFSLETADDHIKSEIDHMADMVILATNLANKKISEAQAALKRQFDKFQAPSLADDKKETKGMDDISRDNNAISQTTQTYTQRLQNAIDTQKKEVPTVSELVRQMALEEDYRTRLSNEIRQEAIDRNNLNEVYLKQKEALSQMIGKTPEEIAFIQQEKDKNDQLGISLENIDTQLETNQATLVKLNATIDGYTQKVKAAQQATQGWAGALSGALTKGLKDASDAMGKEFGNLSDTFITKLLGGSAGGPAGAFIKGFVGDLVSKIFTGDMSSIFGKATPGGNIPNPNVAGNALPSVNGVPSVSIIPTTGSTTDLGQAMVDSLSTLGDISAYAGGGPSSSPMYNGSLAGAGSYTSGTSIVDANGVLTNGSPVAPPITPSEYSNINVSGGSSGNAFAMGLGRIGQGIGGAMSLAQGYSQGGLGGAVESGLGALSLIEAIAPSFGPWGIAIAGLAAVGSLLVHHDNPAEMPDKYNTQQYGQGVANLTGATAGANGQTFNPDQQILQQTNNQGEIAYIEEQLAAGKPANMTQAQYDQLVSEFGKSATGSGTLNFGHDLANQWITGAAGASSTPTNYLQLDSDAQSAMQAFATAAAAMLQAQQNADNLAASFTTMMLNAPSGFVIPGAIVGNAPTTLTKGGIPLAPGGGSTVPTTGGKKPPSTPTHPTHPIANPNQPAPDLHVHLFENASIGTDVDMEKAINDAVPALANAVNEYNFRMARYRNGYSSVTTG